MNGKLKRCPCGYKPKRLCITEGSISKYAYVEADCGCGWATEFKTVNYDPFSEASMEKAIEAWNGMERGCFTDGGL